MIQKKKKIIIKKRITYSFYFKFLEIENSYQDDHFLTNIHCYSFNYLLIYIFDFKLATHFFPDFFIHYYFSLLFSPQLV